MHLTGLLLCREGSALESEPKLHRDKHKISIQLAAAAVCVCVPTSRVAVLAQSRDESNWEWRATCS